MRLSDLSGIWLKQYVGFFDTEELKLIKDMANADMLISVWFELMDLAGKLGCSGRFLLHDTKPYTEDMLAASLKRTTPSIRQCLQTFVQFEMLTYEDGIYSVTGWSEMQDAETLDSIRKGNRERKARERSRKKRTGTNDDKREKVFAYLAAHPTASNTETARATGISRPTVIKYRREGVLSLPVPDSAGEDAVKNAGVKSVKSVKSVKVDTVKIDSFDGVKVDTALYTGFYSDGSNEAAGSEAKSEEIEAVKKPSRPKIIDVDEDIDTATSTAGTKGRMQVFTPSREEVHAFSAANGISPHLADRFFDVNEKRGWVTKTRKPVDDWKGLLVKWAAGEHTPVTAEAPSPREPEHTPTVEEVMAKYGCDREGALAIIQEGMA